MIVVNLSLGDRVLTGLVRGLVGRSEALGASPVGFLKSQRESSGLVSQENLQRRQKKLDLSFFSFKNAVYLVVVSSLS